MGLQEGTEGQASNNMYFYSYTGLEYVVTFSLYPSRSIQHISVQILHSHDI